MFKVGQIKSVPNEKVIIKPFEHEQGSFKNGKTVYKKIKSLEFEVYGDNYSFKFMMKSDLKKLLDMPMGENIDFQEYLFTGETFFDIDNKESFMDPTMDIKIYRYLENSYEITVHFDTGEINSTTDYTGIVQFDFDLNDFLNK